MIPSLRDREASSVYSERESEGKREAVQKHKGEVTFDRDERGESGTNVSIKVVFIVSLPLDMFINTCL